MIQLKDQRQESGDSSTNLQAGRDVHATFIQEVADPTVAMEIARKVAQWEIEKYHEAAWVVVESRLEEFRSEVIKRIDTLDPKRLESFKDPDVQMMLRDAQRSYARSGRPDVCRTLVDLVAARCSTQSGGFQAAVISEAVEAVRKLTPAAIAALTVSFILTRTKAVGVTSPDQLIAWLIENVGPFIDELPSGVHEYEFLEATRSASISPAFDLPKILLEGYGGLLQRGITREQIPDPLWAAHEKSTKPLFVPCLRDQSKLHANVLNRKEAIAFAESAGLSTIDYRSTLAGGQLSDQETMEFISAAYPKWNKLLDSWNTTSLKNLRLTSVGIAIGHSNWSNRTGGRAPLSIWLPDY